MYEFIPIDGGGYRIKAKKDIRLFDMCIKAGTLGGFVTSPNNIKLDGNSWIDPVSSVTDNSTIYNNVLITNSHLSHNVHIFDNTLICDSKINGNISMQFSPYGKAHITNSIIEGHFEFSSVMPGAKGLTEISKMEIYNTDWYKETYQYLETWCITYGSESKLIIFEKVTDELFVRRPTFQFPIDDFIALESCKTLSKTQLKYFQNIAKVYKEYIRKYDECGFNDVKTKKFKTYTHPLKNVRYIELDVDKKNNREFNKVNKNYDLQEEPNSPLYRLVAARNLYYSDGMIIPKGTVGGLVKTHPANICNECVWVDYNTVAHNAWLDDDCRILDNAKAYRFSRVSGSLSIVKDNAVLYNGVKVQHGTVAGNTLLRGNVMIYCGAYVDIDGEIDINNHHFLIDNDSVLTGKGTIKDDGPVIIDDGTAVIGTDKQNSYLNNIQINSPPYINVFFQYHDELVGMTINTDETKDMKLKININNLSFNEQVIRALESPASNETELYRREFCLWNRDFLKLLVNCFKKISN